MRCIFQHCEQTAALMARVIDAQQDALEEGEGGAVEAGALSALNREPTAVPIHLLILSVKGGIVGRDGKGRKGVGQIEDGHQGGIRNRTQSTILLLGGHKPSMIADGGKEVVGQ